MSMRTHHRTPDCGCGLPGETLVFWRPSRCPFPKHTFDPPFNVVGSSHIALGVAEPGRSRAFFCDARLPAARTATATPSPGAAARRGGIRVPMGGTDRAASGLRSRLRGASRQQSCQILQSAQSCARVRRARPSCAHPAPILRGSLPATAVGRAGAGVERRLAWFAAKVVVAEQDHTATKTPSECTQPAGAERQHRIDR
jgi:hypothetical protein